MMRPALAALLLLATPLAVVAQDDAPAAAQQDPQTAYKELAQSYQQAMNAWQEELQAKIAAAKESGERLPRSAYAPPSREFISRAQSLAKQHAGSDDAVMFLGFILKSAVSERNAVKWAVKTLYSDHVESEVIGDIVDYLPRTARMARDSVKLLSDVADNHAHPEVRSRALLARARMNVENDRTDAAVADLELVQKLTKDEDMLDEAREGIVEARKLAVGAVAPDIVGVDVDGTAFKLSDYRGKAVLLDFWGFW